MKMFKKLGLPMVIAALMVVMAACGGGTSNKTTDTSKQNDNKTAQKADLSGSLVLSGSTALQPLASAAAEQFMNTNSKVSIQVNGGGSGTGLSQVSQGAVQIGNSDVFAEEKNISGLVDNKVAVVGMTAAVNPKVILKPRRDVQHRLLHLLYTRGLKLEHVTEINVLVFAITALFKPNPVRIPFHSGSPLS